MPALEQHIREYLDHVLGVSARVSAWDGAARLPAFLTARYRFVKMSLLGREFLLMLDEEPEPVPPAAIRKHAEQVRAKWPGLVIYGRDRVTAYNRKRLIEQRVPFIVPGNQMYLPDLGIDLREYIRTPAPTQRTFRPATQATLIFLLLHHDGDGAIASELAPALGYSTMTLSRAFDELESVKLATSEAAGRERVLRLQAPRRRIWEQARPWLVSPVRSRHFLSIRPDGLSAGYDALARYTMLAEPTLAVTAISHRDWLALSRAHADTQRFDAESATCEVEVWHYEPTEYERPGVVDPLSLILAIGNTGDERVEQALEALVEQVKW